MRQHFPTTGLVKLCELFGKTRQAWYEATWHQEQQCMYELIIVQEVQRIREILPRLGTRKLYFLLQEFLQLHHIKIGRDKLFTVLKTHNLLVKRTRSRVRTTISQPNFLKYSNLIHHFSPTAIHQLWVSDITYIRLFNGFCYLTLITDAYSRLIVGYCLWPSLHAEGVLNALKMALANLPKDTSNLIHHSDRGVQYCSNAYIELLEKRNIKISMAKRGNPGQNALAECMNGILKEEFLVNETFHTFPQARQVIRKTIYKYNYIRPHGSLLYATPASIYFAGEKKKNTIAKYNHIIPKSLLNL